MSSHPANDPTRIPCLDGIRALSIALVLLSHMAGTAGFPAPAGAADYIGSFGQLGVRVFFLISGYLITTLLLAEHEKYGTISLLHFYFRRTFRIFPAFYVYIAVLMAAHAIGWVQLRDGDLVHAATYTTNYHHDRGWEFGHMWSLAVEEQFYLLWPAMFLLLGVRGAIISAGLYILIAPVVRVLTWKLMPEHTDGIGETFQTVADSIATGCVLAAVRPRMHELVLFRLHERHLTPLVYVIMIFALNHVKGSISFSYPVGETMTNVLIALFIDWCLRHPGGRLGTFLDWRPLAYVGVLSYSLYLWQQPFLNGESSALVASFPLNLMCLSAAALASYYLIEKPFLQWRARLGRKWLPRRAPKQ